jgi:hypothetical protein
VFLKTIQDVLDEMGLPVRGWFIEFGSEVFDENGKPDTEPILSSSFLRRVADEMWHLGCRLLVGEIITYEVLADSLRIENTPLVRLAVQRIVRAIHKNKHNPNIIIAGGSGWRWNKTEMDEKSWDRVSVKAIISEALNAVESAKNEEENTHYGQTNRKRPSRNAKH